MGDCWCRLNLNKTQNETLIAVIFYSNDVYLNNGGWSTTNSGDGGLGEREGKRLCSNATS